MKREIIYGIHPVREVLKAGRRVVYKLYTAGDEGLKKDKKVDFASRIRRIPLERTTAYRLQKLAGSGLHQGICAEVGPYPFVSVDEIIRAGQESRSGHFVLLLDHVVDPHNLGALMRTAFAFGVSGVVIPKDRSALPTAAAVKASSGALEHIRLARITNLVNTIKKLKDQGIWIAGLDQNGDVSVCSGRLTVPVALVVGGEEKGIRPLVKRHCDYLVRIPQRPDVDSFNVSVAGAVGMYEIVRQRRNP